MKLKTLLKEYQLYIIGGILGGIGGYFYWSEIGCLNGSCAIQSNPYLTILYGTVMGALLLSFFKKQKNENNISG